MSSTLRILFIEDTENDVFLLLREIQRSGYEVQWERVETEEDIHTALARQEWDVILCDYSMPRMNAPRALEIVKNTGIDIPFIIVSGTIGEEAAVSALKAGAHDFLIKGKLARLLPAIEREIKDTHIRREQKTIQSELHASEERFQKAFRSSPVGMAITRGTDSTYIDANPAYCEITGFTLEELLNQTSLQLNIIKPEQRELYISQIREQGYIHNQEMTLRHKSGEHRLVLGSMEVIELNHEACVLSTAIDITQRNQIEERVRFSDQILQRVNALVLVADSQGSIIYVSPSAHSILGYEPEELLGENWWNASRLDHNQAQVEKKYLQRVARGETPIASEPYERSIYDKWGNIHWISWVDAAGENNTLIGVGHDITERKQAEELLEANERRFRALIENAPDGITLINRKGVVTYVGPSIERILGYSQQEAFGSNAFEYVHPQDRTHLLRQVARLKNQNDQALSQYRFQHKDGSWRWLESTISYLKVEPFMDGIVFNYRDITERKHTEETIQQYASELEERVKERTAQLNQTNLELERANRAKDEFLANMSHELRTPLNSILGLSEALLDQRRDVLTGNQERSLQIIEASGRHLLALISDILDLSKIEAGKFDYYPQSISVDELCRSSLSFIKSQAEKKSIRLTYNNETSVTEIVADPRRLKQVLVNLLTNAVKFTPEHGHVTLEVRANIEQGLIHISVTDTGIGIAQKDLQRLFTPFVQVDSSLTRQFEGTGLGLALAQKLTDLHGGSIAVESEVGKGSRFTVSLYIKQDISHSFEVPKSNQPPLTSNQIGSFISQPAEQRMITRSKILLAEDNEANILTIGEYLESYDYEIIVAHDGVEAVEKALECDPHIILMDIQMPLMNGLEAIQRLRADPRFASTPIIALTALAMVGDRERCIAAGATEYMSKPVSLKSLREMIETLLA